MRFITRHTQRQNVARRLTHPVLLQLLFLLDVKQIITTFVFIRAKTQLTACIHNRHTLFSLTRPTSPTDTQWSLTGRRAMIWMLSALRVQFSVSALQYAYHCTNVVAAAERNGEIQCPVPVVHTLLPESGNYCRNLPRPEKHMTADGVIRRPIAA